MHEAGLQLLEANRLRGDLKPANPDLLAELAVANCFIEA